MSKKIERFKTVIELYARQEQEALQFLGAIQRKLTEQQSQLEQLEIYQLTSQANFAEQHATAISIMRFMELRAFADKLDKAIAGQKTLVAGHEQELSRARRNWEESHQRLENMKKINEIAKSEAVKAENRREQIEHDARAARSQRADGI
ncbi:MAG: flagellar export protein FliJ [Methylomonas sp.]|jgi:flagellar export protein FliJ